MNKHVISEEGANKVDFFISYTGVDVGWAEWVTRALESAGYKVIAQFLDFGAGSNFVLEMDRALKKSKHVMPLLSPDYIRSGFTAAEWAAAFTHDPDASQRLLVPVMIRRAEITGLLGPIVHIKIYDLDEETAKRRLLDGLMDPRKIRSRRPPFPGP